MIRSFSIENFKAIGKAEFGDLAPVNVIAGENGTGKSSVLKLMYALMNTIKEVNINYNGKILNNEADIFAIIQKKIYDVFDPRNTSGFPVGIGRSELSIIKDNSPYNSPTKIARAGVSILTDNNSLNIIFAILPFMGGKCVEVNSVDMPIDHDLSSIYMPPFDIMPYYKSIKSSREKELRKQFNDSIYDLAQALSRCDAADRSDDNMKDFKQDLEDLMNGGKVLFHDAIGDFVYQKGDKSFAISLTAEGTRKIGLLYQLVLNREITPGTVLFIDEPENSLHPSLLMKFLEALVNLSKPEHDVQIFMATHNYFVLKQLEIIARRDNYPIRCFSLKLDENDTAYINDHSDMRNLMPDNAILDASMDLLDAQMALKPYKPQ